MIESFQTHFQNFKSDLCFLLLLNALFLFAYFATFCISSLFCNVFAQFVFFLAVCVSQYSFWPSHEALLVTLKSLSPQTHGGPAWIHFTSSL